MDRSETQTRARVNAICRWTLLEVKTSRLMVLQSEAWRQSRRWILVKSSALTDDGVDLLEFGLSLMVPDLGPRR